MAWRSVKKAQRQIFFTLPFMAETISTLGDDFMKPANNTNATKKLYRLSALNLGGVLPHGVQKTHVKK
jgi:hypothetical protein